ncbi:hypothetical protein ACJZ2D_005248 [Fusarium nematophilum]
MAEAAGLALSGIAFTSLLTSRVDILEYFNNGRRWIQDLGLALTKVNHLKICLGQFENTLHLDPVDGCSNDMSHAALRGLSGIDVALEQTNELCKRYSYLPLGKDGPITAISSADVCRTGQSHHQRGELSDVGKDRGELCGPGAWHRLGEKVCWAVQDKRRFDRLISGLEFLLSNIEKLASSLNGDTEDYSLPKSRLSPVTSHEKEPQNPFQIPA